MPAFLAAILPILLPVLTGGLTSLFKLSGSLVSSLVKGAVSVGVGIINGAMKAVSLVLNTLAFSLKAVGALIGGAAAAFVAGLKLSVSSLLDYAHNVASISDQTGMGIGPSLKLTNRFQSMGIDPKETASIFGSREMAPQLFNARARAVGAPDIETPNFGPQLAAWFQAEAKKGLGGFLGARAKLDAAFGGNAPASILRLVNQRPETLQRELNYGEQVQKKLGISPKVVEQASSEFPLLINRISTFVDAVKMKFAAEMLPTLKAVFGVVSDVFVNNSGRIADVLKKVGHFMFVDFAGYALDGAQIVIDGGRAIVNGFADFGLGIAGFLRSVEAGQNGFFAFFEGIADSISGFLRAAEAGQSGLFSFFEGIGTLIDNITGMAAKVGIGTGTDIAGGMEKVRTSGALGKAADAVDSFKTFRKSGALGDAADKIEGVSNSVRDRGNAGFDWLQGVKDQGSEIAGTQAEREATWQRALLEEMRAQTKAIRALDGKSAPQTSQRTGMSADKILDVLGSQLASQAIRQIHRR